MSGPFGSHNFMTKGAPTESSQSLRFNDDDVAYLSRTPTTASNRKTYTFSAWVKLSSTGNLGVFHAGPDIGSRDDIYFSSGYFVHACTINYSPKFSFQSSAVFRDPSAWYHIVVAVDTTQAISTDRIKHYVNGEEITSYAGSTYPQLNVDGLVNSTNVHHVGALWTASNLFDGYMAEVNFVDGLALDPTSFGETDANGQWVPIIAPSLTYGTNGFYLPFTNDYSVEGFNTVTYRGNGGTQYVGGVGFEPDLVWIKSRSTTYDHQWYDTVRGPTKRIFSNKTDAELTGSDLVQSFDTDGFTIGTNVGLNSSSHTYVAWSWDMGTGSPVSNTDGSITSTVKANPAYGQSIVSYTGNGTAGATVGHGLSSAPEMVIVKSRTSLYDWLVGHESATWNTFLRLNTTDTAISSSGAFQNTAPTSSVVTMGAGYLINGNDPYIMYCFHSVAGYSSFGSYVGTGASGNTVTTGFKPAFVMVKRTDVSGDSWFIFDNTRKVTNPKDLWLAANLNFAETQTQYCDFTDTGFTVNSTIGAFNASGGTYIYMAFADKREAAFWLDQSGNNNDWTNNNMQESDISLDSPLNNFATLSPIACGKNSVGSLPVLSEGNLSVYESTASYSTSLSTIPVSSGKWYFEVFIYDNTYPAVGWMNVDEPSTFFSENNMYLGKKSNSYSYFYTGVTYNNNSSAAYGTGFSAGDVIGCALDLDSGTMTFYHNNTSQGTAFSSLSGTFVGGITVQSSRQYANFGQDSSFAGNKTAQGYQDANGIGDFYYEPPAGYLALCTDNLPDPVIKDGSEHFNTVLYTGNASTQSITGVGFQPDFTWIKTRSIAYYHRVFDSVRGVANGLYTNATSAEATYASLDGVTSFDADGFSLDSKIGTNENSASYVAWNWKADNTSGTTNTDGSITSTVSANTTAGFSIVGYTGNGISGSTVGHGLTQFPQLILQKNRSAAIEWASFTTAIDGSYDYFYLDLANAAGNGGPDSNSDTVFTVYDNYTNQSGANHIAYCFHSVEGYSKIGSYTGNGSTDGPFVYTGFRPAFVMVKRTNNTGNWLIQNNKALGYNPSNSELYANLGNTEVTADRADFLSNGFKPRVNSAENNASGSTYIYMAFAENPFKYSNAR